MGQLRQMPQGRIELDGFPLEAGDGMALLLLGSWVSGSIAHDEHGWYLMAQEGWGIRLQTGLRARLLWLSSEIVSQQSWAMSQVVFSEGACSLSSRSTACWCGWKERNLKARRERRASASRCGW
jgi:hypothetical protein